MKRTILTIILAVFAITAIAQNEETSIRVPNGYQGFLEEGNSWHFDKNMPTSINLSTTHGFYFNGHMFVGVGLGFEFNSDFVMVPFYTNLRYVFNNHSTVSPVLSLRLGSYLSQDIGAYGDLAFGVRFASKKDFAVNVCLAGTYYDRMEVSEWVEEYDEHNVYVSGHYVQHIVSPSGISLRIGIEW